MDLSSDFFSNGGEWAYYDGNMKELWDFNRNSVKSYLFFLIYFTKSSAPLAGMEKDLRNKSIRDKVRNKEIFSRFCWRIRSDTIKP